MKLFKYLIAGAVILFSIQLKAQDYIYTRSGYEIKAKSINVNSESISYYQFDDVDSGKRGMPIHKIDSIVYKDGKVRKFEYVAPPIKKTDPYYHTEDRDPSLPRLKLEKGFWGSKYYRNNEKVSKSLFMQTLATNQDAYRLYNRGTDQKLLGNIIGAPSGFFVGYTAGKYFRGEKTNPKVFGAALVFSIISLTLETKGKSKMESAVQKFNAYQSDDSGFIIKFEGTKLSCTF